jgi:hypothetical protein
MGIVIPFHERQKRGVEAVWFLELVGVLSKEEYTLID